MTEELTIIDAEIVHEPLAPIDLSPEQKAEALVIRQEIAEAVNKTRQGYENFMHGFVRLGSLLFEVRSKRYWNFYGYHSFNAFIGEVGEAVDKRRTQLYGSISVAERLLPSVPEEKLERLGITNATALARMVKTTGRIPSAEIVDLGIRLKLPEYRAELEKEFRVFGDKAKGKWREIGGAWWTDEEWKTFQQAYGLLVSQDDNNTNETPDWMKLKKVILAMSMEIIATYSEVSDEPKSR